MARKTLVAKERKESDEDMEENEEEEEGGEGCTKNRWTPAQVSLPGLPAIQGLEWQAAISIRLASQPQEWLN